MPTEIDWWKVSCPRCPTTLAPRFATHDEAVAAGRAHVADWHAMDEEWEFRVRGYRSRQRDRASSGT